MSSLTEQLVQFIEAKSIADADLAKASDYVLDALANTRAEVADPAEPVAIPAAKRFSSVR